MNSRQLEGEKHRQSIGTGDQGPAGRSRVEEEGKERRVQGS